MSEPTPTSEPPEPPERLWWIGGQYYGLTYCVFDPKEHLKRRLPVTEYVPATPERLAAGKLRKALEHVQNQLWRMEFAIGDGTRGGNLMEYIEEILAEAAASQPPADRPGEE